MIARRRSESLGRASHERTLAGPDIGKMFQRRLEKWQLLRYLYSIKTLNLNRGNCIENIFWEIEEIEQSERSSGRALFVSVLVNGLGCQRDPRLYKHLASLYDCFSTEDGQLDWRELQCSLYALDSTRYVYENPTKLLTIFFALYRVPVEHGGAVLREDIARIISLAAVSHRDIASTAVIIHHLPKVVTFPVFENTLAKYPHITEAFRLQVWKQLPDSSKLRYLKLREDVSAGWFEGYVHRRNVLKALNFRRMTALSLCFKAWCWYHQKALRIRLQQRKVVLRKSSAFLSWWHSHTVQQYTSHEQRQVATVLGHRALLRRVFILRWRRYNCNERRIRKMIIGFTGRSAHISHGNYLARHAITSATKRNAIGQWREWIISASRWDKAGVLMCKLIKTRFLQQWISHIHLIKRFRVAEEQSISKQIYLAAIIKRAEEKNKTNAAAAQQDREDNNAKQKRQLATEKLHKIAWKHRAQEAERAANNHIKLSVQREERAKRIACEKEDRAASFCAAWEAIEHQYIQQQYNATRAWLDSSSSKSHVSKAFKRIKREFFHPPTPRSMDREAKLKSLTSIVLIKMEAVLFQQGIVMEHFVRQYDGDSSGFLSHNEFKSLLRDLPISLSPEQVRVVIKSLDVDNDGYLGLEELEEALHEVHLYNGVSASPWRMYIDPAQDVMCYHNLASGELVFEHHMHDAKLMEITRSNFVAEAQLEAINHIRRERAMAWTRVKEDYASVVMARMYRSFKSKKEQGRLMWKIQARQQRSNAEQHAVFATRLQCWWRAVRAKKCFTARLRHHVEVVPDLVERRLYYFNHNTHECAWKRPRGGECLHAPQDYVLAHENDRVYFVKWSMSPDEAHLRMWNKPPGYLRCTRCLQNIALLECVDTPGVFCFACFRGSFNAYDFASGVRKQRRVRPVGCSLCAQGRPASWRCMKAQHNVHIYLCSLCFQRSEHRGAAWSRI